MKIKEIIKLIDERIKSNEQILAETSDSMEYSYLRGLCNGAIRELQEIKKYITEDKNDL